MYAETVKDFISGNLITYDFTEEEDDEILNYILENLKEFSLTYKDNPEQKPIKDCWDVERDLFTITSLQGLRSYSERYIIEWCKKKIDSLKK